MPAETEQRLLSDFVADRDDAAFGRLVERHIDMVYGCALRRTGDAGLAEEISQNVFTILARKAHGLKAGAGLAGWLHKTAVYESAKALRGESRRRRKMKALAEHSQTQHETDVSADEVLPLVDEAIDELPEGDRRMILLHYFEGHSFRDIAQAVGKSEAASQKQTSRAVGKLGKILRRRGVVASAAALAPILVAESAKAAPAGIASTISGGALAGASSLTTTTLITNAIQTMTYAKTKVAIIVTAAAAVPVGVQMKSIGSLKQDLQVYEQREVEFNERGARLAQLEATVAALPPGLIDPGGKPDLVRAREVLSALTKRPAVGGARRTGSPAGVLRGRSKSAGGSAAQLAEQWISDLAASGAAPESLEDMMQEPAMRSILKKMQRVEVEMTYGDLLDYFELDEGGRGKVSEALLAREMALSEAGMDILDEWGEGKIGSGDVAKISKIESEHNAKLEALLGETRFEEFDRFEQSASERQELEAFRESLKEQGQDLPFETEQKLMAIMYEENNSPSGLSDFPDLDELSQGVISPDATAAVLDMQRETHSRIRTRVAEVLTARQLETFKTIQDSNLKLMQSGLEMYGDLFEGEE